MPNGPATSADVIDLADIVDLDRYPIDDLTRPEAIALVERCRAALIETGICQLPGFLTARSVERMVAEADGNVDRLWHTDDAHTVYFEDPDPDVDPLHPRAHLVHSSESALAYDRIAPDAPARRLYESDEMTQFVAALLGKDELYRSADPLDALQIAFFADGDELGWHFDNSEFSVTLMYREAEAGGHFEYHPALRSADDENESGVARAIHGDGSEAIRISTAPGTLAVFRGHHALHRVTRVSGPVTRINSVFTYFEEPGRRLSPLTQQLFYGRNVDPQ